MARVVISKSLLIWYGTVTPVDRLDLTAMGINGEFSYLQTLILGNRDDVEEMPASSSAVLTTVLKLIDKYDLYGQVAYPKHHKQSEVPDIYRLAAKTKV